MRTEGIYTIMITLAIGVAFYYLAQQNYAVFNGFQGFQQVLAPTVLGVDWRDAGALLLPGAVLGAGRLLLHQYLVVRAPFGIALQGIRDNPRRMNALGFNVTAHRIAAYAVAGFIAAVGGVLLTWYNGLISPGSVGIGADQHPDHRRARRHAPSGRRRSSARWSSCCCRTSPSTWSIASASTSSSASCSCSIVLFSPDGLLGWWSRLAARWPAGGARSSGAGAGMTP